MKFAKCINNRWLLAGQWKQFSKIKILLQLETIVAKRSRIICSKYFAHYRKYIYLNNIKLKVQCQHTLLHIKFILLVQVYIIFSVRFRDIITSLYSIDGAEQTRWKNCIIWEIYICGAILSIHYISVRISHQLKQNAGGTRQSDSI